MKQKTAIRLTVLAIILPFMLLLSCTRKQNWPQFRGPNGNMVIAGANLPEEWGNDKNVKWTYKMDGAGWSSPVVWGNKVFIASTFPEKVAPVPEMPPRPPMPEGGDSLAPGQNPPPAGGQDMGPGQRPQQGPGGPQQGTGPQPGGPGGPGGPRPEDNDTTYKTDIYRWEVTCIDLNTGKELWKQVANRGNPRVRKGPQNTYASETPVTDGKRVYAYFGMTGLYCYDMNGKPLWQKDLGAYKTQAGWGTGSSPAIYKDILYIQVDNDENSFITAINAATGDEKWKVQRDEKTTYSTPYIWTNKVRTELIANGKTACSYDPENGKLLWELKAGGEQTIPSPVGDAERLFIGNSGGRETKGSLFAVKAGAEGNITPKEGEMTSSGVEWVIPDAGLGNASLLLYNDLIYIIGGRGDILCVNSTTGAQVYKTRISGAGAIWASPWACNDKIWFLNENGITRAMKAGEKYEMLSENKLDDKFWTSVAVAGDAYIFKGAEKLYCVGK